MTLLAVLSGLSTTILKGLNATLTVKALNTAVYRLAGSPKPFGDFVSFEAFVEK